MRRVVIICLAGLLVLSLTGVSFADDEKQEKKEEKRQEEILQRKDIELQIETQTNNRLFYPRIADEPRNAPFLPVEQKQ